MSFLLTLLLSTAGATAPNCDALKDKYESYTEHDSKRYFDADQAREVLAFLENLPRIEPAQVAEKRAALEKNFAEAWMPWLATVYGDCTQTRLMYVRALMRSALHTPALKSFVKPRVTALMARPRDPTLLSVMIDVVLIDFGLTEKFWDEDKALLAEVKAFRMTVKAYSGRFTELYGETLEHEDLGEGPPTPARAAATTERLKKSPNLPKIKTAILEEFDHAQAFQAQIAKFVARLK